MLCSVKEYKLKKIDGGSVTSPIGYIAKGINCGIRKNKKDLGILFSEMPAVSAAVYTTNKFQAAPLQVSKQSIENSNIQKALIVNSGNANAFTGKQGITDATLMRNKVAECLNIQPEEAVIASTGVIGEKLPIELIINGIDEITVDMSKDKGLDFANAILTTDTITKNIAVEIEVEGKTITIGGTAKGSGMIHPNMATMLAFITTDANLEKNSLQKLLGNITNSTFNMITVDGDTSTNDMVYVMANGAVETNQINENHKDWDKIYQGFKYVSEELAKMIARDGEGATKLITVTVDGAESEEMAKTIAMKIVGSNLVKTAVFGADANWGRLIMAIGNSGYDIDADKLDIKIGKIDVLKNGKPLNYEESILTEQFEHKEVEICININIADKSAKAWGCDLTYDYVRINASYRT